MRRNRVCKNCLALFKQQKTQSTNSLWQSLSAQTSLPASGPRPRQHPSPSSLTPATYCMHTTGTAPLVSASPPVITMVDRRNEEPLPEIPIEFPSPLPDQLSRGPALVKMDFPVQKPIGQSSLPEIPANTSPVTRRQRSCVDQTIPVSPSPSTFEQHKRPQHGQPRNETLQDGDMDEEEQIQLRTRGRSRDLLQEHEHPSLSSLSYHHQQQQDRSSSHQLSAEASQREKSSSLATAEEPQKPSYFTKNPRKEISTTASARQLMRQVSGLGMEDPVYGNDSASNINTFHPSQIFQDMSAEDIPDDMKDMISIASDPTATPDSLLPQLEQLGVQDISVPDTTKPWAHQSYSCSSTDPTMESSSFLYKSTPPLLQRKTPPPSASRKSSLLNTSDHSSQSGRPSFTKFSSGNLAGWSGNSSQDLILDSIREERRPQHLQMSLSPSKSSEGVEEDVESPRSTTASPQEIPFQPPIVSNEPSQTAPEPKEISAPILMDVPFVADTDTKKDARSIPGMQSIFPDLPPMATTDAASSRAQKNPMPTMAKAKSKKRSLRRLFPKSFASKSSLG